jgi:hypothetical protein
MSLPACMGGWCLKREACADYHATDRAVIEDRLCPPGQDDPSTDGQIDATDERWWQSIRTVKQ